MENMKNMKKIEKTNVHSSVDYSTEFRMQLDPNAPDYMTKLSASQIDEIVGKDDVNKAFELARKHLKVVDQKPYNDFVTNFEWRSRKDLIIEWKEKNNRLPLLKFYLMNQSSDDHMNGL